jgi:hypothetical protein
MDERHLTAYVLLLLIVASVVAAAWRHSRRWRSDRRASGRFTRDQDRRRAGARAARRAP